MLTLDELRRACTRTNARTPTRTNVAVRFRHPRDVHGLREHPGRLEQDRGTDVRAVETPP